MSCSFFQASTFASVRFLALFSLSDYIYIYIYICQDVSCSFFQASTFASVGDDMFLMLWVILVSFKRLKSPLCMFLLVGMYFLLHIRVCAYLSLARSLSRISQHVCLCVCRRLVVASWNVACFVFVVCVCEGSAYMYVGVCGGESRSWGVGGEGLIGGYMHA